MIDSLITNPNGFYDDLCNQIILYSSTVSKELGMSYSELWIGIMIGFSCYLFGIIFYFYLIYILHIKKLQNGYFGLVI